MGEFIRAPISIKEELIKKSTHCILTKNSEIVDATSGEPLKKKVLNVNHINERLELANQIRLVKDNDIFINIKKNLPANSVSELTLKLTTCHKELLDVKDNV